jgi:F-type H+-transporting ATPase subunit b
MITFGLLVLFTMKYVWPPIIKAMQDRQKRIAEGLAAAEQGAKAQEDAEAQAAITLKEAKQQAQELLMQADKQRNEMIEKAKGEAQAEGKRQLTAAQAEIEQEVNRAREQLRQQVSQLAVSGAGRILGREIDAQAHAKLLDDLVAQL